MLSGWSKNLFKLKEIVGVEVTFLPEERIAFNCVHLSIDKKTLVIKKKIAVSSIEEIKSIFAHNIPVCLSLNGRGVLHKKAPPVASDAQKSIAALLPNAKAEDFYLQQHTIGNTEVISSVIRKRTLHDVLENFKKAELPVVDVVLGIFAIEKLLPLMDSQLGRLQMGAHYIEISNHKIVSYNYEKNDYTSTVVKVDKEEVDERFLVSYATALQGLLGSGSKLLEIEELRVAKDEVFHKAVFKVAGASMLIFFLAALLINFMLFSSYTERYEELSGNQLKYAGFKNDLDTLLKHAREQEAFLNDAGWMKTSRISYYADQIGEAVPMSITLKELSINPWQEAQSRSDKKFIFAVDKISISGNCHEPTDLDPWIQNLRSMSWVGAVEIQNYAYDNRDRKGVFLITITIK